MVYDTASRAMRKPLAPPKNTPVDDIEVRYRHQAMHLLCIAGLGGLPRSACRWPNSKGCHSACR